MPKNSILTAMEKLEDYVPITKEKVILEVLT